MDEILKTSDVEVISFHKTLGGRMVHSVVSGSISSVHVAMKNAYEIGNKLGKENVKVAMTISNPHKEILKLMNMINKDDKETKHE